MELIKIETNDRGEQVVSGRTLHEQLGVKTHYKDWIARKLKTYGFIENTDFIMVAQKRATINPNNPWTEIIDHALTLDTAKELAMITNTEKGREIRRYFIQAEKEYNEKLRLSYTKENPSLADVFNKNNEIARILVANGVSRRVVMKAVLAKTQADSGEDLTPFLSVLEEIPDRLTPEQAIINSKEPWNGRKI